MILDLQFQDKAKEDIGKVLCEKDLPSALLISGTGTGKTYILAKLLRELYTKQFFDKYPLTLIKVLYVTKASVVEQTVRVLKEFGLSSSHTQMGLDVFVTNYDQLRSSLGELIISDYTVIEHNEAVIKYKWKENLTPILIIWDECHSLMNEQSQQSKIAQAINDLELERLVSVKQIFASATPFGRVSEAKCFAVSTRTSYKYGFVTSPLTNKHWMDFAIDIAGSNVKEFSPSACKELMFRLKDYIVHVKNARSKFHARNSTVLIDFETPAEAHLYKQAWEEYQQKLREAKGYELDGIAAVLVALLKFRQAAELIRSRQFAKRMYHCVQEGFAAGCAVNFRATIAKTVEILTQDYGVSREKISLIWGGIEDVASLKDSFQGLELGSQSRKQRQQEIDKFQRGDSLYCFYTFKSGGVGLSLHHENPNCRPRKAIIAPTYNAKELVQGLGRFPRLTSLSDTIQEMVFYRGTVEESVAERVAVKLKCLRAVVSQRESWSDILTDIKDVEGVSMLSESGEDENENEDGGFIEDVDGEDIIDI